MPDCPELAKFDDKYIYSPHLAPMEAQKKAGCIIGQDYPAPILDEKEEKSNCIARCKAAFTVSGSASCNAGGRTLTHAGSPGQAARSGQGGAGGQGGGEAAQGARHSRSEAFHGSQERSEQSVSHAGAALPPLAHEADARPRPAWAKAKAEKEEPASTKKEEEEHLHEAAGGESATADKQPARPKRKAPAASASGSKGKRAKSEK
jgi:hypothetical protein